MALPSLVFTPAGIFGNALAFTAVRSAASDAPPALPSVSHTTWIAIVPGDLPGSNPGSGMIDVVPVAARSLYAVVLPAPALPEASPTAQGLAPATLKNISVPTGVEGESGRSQVFELAATNVETSKPTPDPLPVQSAKADHGEAASDAPPAGAASEALLLSMLSQNASPWQAGGISQGHERQGNRPGGSPATVHGADGSAAQAAVSVRPQIANVRPGQPHTIASGELTNATEVAVWLPAQTDSRCPNRPILRASPARRSLPSWRKTPRSIGPCRPTFSTTAARPWPVWQSWHSPGCV